jgi:hypothetical protein
MKTDKDGGDGKEFWQKWTRGMFTNSKKVLEFW